MTDPRNEQAVWQAYSERTGMWLDFPADRIDWHKERGYTIRALYPRPADARVPERKKEGMWDERDDAYNRGWNDCIDEVLGTYATPPATVKESLTTAQDARVPEGWREEAAEWVRKLRSVDVPDVVRQQLILLGKAHDLIERLLATPPAAKPEQGERCPECVGTGGHRWFYPDGTEAGEKCATCDGFGHVDAQPKPAGEDAVTVPREVVAAYARSTHIPRHRRICEEALAKPAGDAVGAEACKWEQEDMGADCLATGCGNLFYLPDAENHEDGAQVFKHCPFCAKPAVFHKWRDESRLSGQEG